MNYKVIIREIEYVNRVVYAEAVRTYYQVSHDDILLVEPEEE